MANIDGFDATDIPPAEAFEVIPAGRYTAVIVESDVVPTRSNNGQMAKFTWQIVDGPHTNRKLFQNLNIDNPNEKAVEIAKRELSAICHAVGVLRPRDTAELHNVPCTIVVKVTPAKDGYEAKNDIKAVEPLGKSPAKSAAAATTAQAAPAAPAATASPAKSAAAKKPWQK